MRIQRGRGGTVGPRGGDRPLVGSIKLGGGKSWIPRFGKKFSGGADRETKKRGVRTYNVIKTTEK